MPLGPKLVLSLLSVSLALNVFFGFARPSTREAVVIALQSAIVIGLYARQTVAWLAVRWLSAIAVGLALFLLVLLLILPFTGERQQFWTYWAYLAFQTALVWVLFFLLGRTDSRVYFNAPRKA